MRGVALWPKNEGIVVVCHIQIPKGLSGAALEAFVDHHFADTTKRARLQTAAEADAARRELRHGFVDATKLRFGIPVDRPHPFCRELNESSFEQWAKIFGRGLTTSDFGDAIADAYSQIATPVPNPWDMSGFMADVTAPNYKDVTLSTVTVESPRELEEDGSAPFASVASQAISGRVSEFCINLGISRRVLLDSDKSFVDGLVSQSISRLNAIPAKLLGAIITANPVLGDGQQLFTTVNSVSGSGHTGAALNQAISLLAHQTTHDGSVIGFQPSALLVSHDVAVTYATLLSALAPVMPLKLQICPWMPTNTAFLLCDPSECPSFNRLLLRGGNAPRVVLGERPDRYDEDGQKISYNGIAISVQWTVGVAAVSRRGVVKISA